jgi:hypothetical protein
VNARKARIYAIACFMVAGVCVAATLAHADAPPPPTINVADVPASPTPLPKLVLSPERFALAASPQPEASAAANGEVGGISLIATSYDHSNPANSCAIIVDNGQVENKCVGERIGKVALAAVDADDNGIELSDGRHIGVVNDATQTLNAEVPGVGNSGLPAQSVPVNIAPSGAQAVTMPTSNLAHPGAAAVPQVNSAANSGASILNALGLPIGPSNPGASGALPAAGMGAGVPQGIPTPTVLNPNALPTPSFINP